MIASAVKTAPTPANEAAPDVRRLGLNLLLLTGGELLAKLLTFLAFSYLARVLGPDRYGNLEFTLAVMVFFTLPADLGLGSYAAREIARNRADARRLLGEIIELRVFLSSLSMLALFGFLLVIPKPFEVKLMLALYGASLLPSALMLQWFFQAHDLMRWVAVASITRQSVFAILAFAILRPGMSLAWIGLSECVSVCTTAIVCTFLARSRMRIRLPSLRFPLHRLASHLRQSFPIGMTELAWAFSWYFVTVLLGMLFDHEPLSYFGASHRVLMALHTFVWLYFFNLLPSISRCKGQPSGHLLNLIQPSLRLAAWTSVFVAFLMTAISRDALSLVYGRPFAEAGTSFSILVWMLPIAMMSGHYRYILIGFNLQRRLFQCTAASAVAAIALGLLLAPRFGASGGAWALVAANAVNFALVHAAVRREVMSIPFWGELVRPAFALIAGTSLFLLARQWNSVWLAAAAGSLAYIAVLALSLGRQALNLIFPAKGEPIDAMEDCAG